MSGRLGALVLVVVLLGGGCSRAPAGGTSRPGGAASVGARVERAPDARVERAPDARVERATASGDARTSAPRTSRPRTSSLSRRAASSPAQRARQAQPEALRVLHGWDRRRARAYALGSPPALRGLYVRGSRAGRADVRLLRDYVARGYRVEGMRMQVLGFRVLAHATGRWRLLVTDRLERAVAVRAGTRMTLPRDLASTRVVTLVRGEDSAWRVASVSGALSPARRPAGRASSGPRT